MMSWNPEELDSSGIFEGLKPPIDYSKEIFLWQANQLKNSHKYESGILNVS